MPLVDVAKAKKGMSELMEDEVIKMLEDVLGRKIKKEEIKYNDLSKVEGWDSLKHISLIVALEEKFNCNIEPEEIQKMKNGICSIVKILEGKK